MFLGILQSSENRWWTSGVAKQAPQAVRPGPMPAEAATAVAEAFLRVMAERHPGTSWELEGEDPSEPAGSGLANWVDTKPIVEAVIFPLILTADTGKESDSGAPRE
jgi:hypothetical protein